MKKIKLKGFRKWFSGFFSNLLSVIIGIILTFGISSIIQSNNEKDDITKMMVLIRNEMSENKKWFNTIEENYKKDFHAYKKILATRGHWENTPKDSLIIWIKQLITANDSDVKTSSWEVFKNSNSFTKHKNKKLTVALNLCYLVIDKMNNIVNKYYEEKNNSHKNVFELYEQNPVAYLTTLFENAESKYFLERMVLSKEYDFLEEISGCNFFIEYTLYLIDSDKYYDIQNAAEYEDYRLSFAAWAAKYYIEHEIME
ncbi:MAG: hypothetical protein LBC68_13810 [Prevotellaceae bacterium]|jgi:hypothetical protein|nr:hypothetical protein [Prevotellaceae bacterium]